FLGIHAQRPGPTPPGPTPPPPPPPANPPTLSVIARGDLDRDGAVTIHFELDRNAPERLEIGYHLESIGTRQGRDFTVTPQAGPLSIEANGRRADLVLKKEPRPVSSNAPAARTSQHAEIRLAIEAPRSVR